MESYYNTPYLSRNARVLLNASAFEILLSLPEIQQRKAFKEKIKKVVSLKGEQEYSYWTKIGGKSKKFKGTVAEIWADKFYSLRNNIIHGNNILPKEFVFKNYQSHLDISCLFFIFLLKKQLEKSLGNSCECDYEIRWDKWTEEFPAIREIQGFVFLKSYKKLFKRLLRKRPIK